MSARPRPVTATFPPPVFAEHPQCSHSLSPGSSTASLVSVLDHISCASLVEDVENSPVAELGSTTQCETKHLQLGTVSSQQVRSAQLQSHITDKTTASDMKQKRQSAKSVASKLPLSSSVDALLTLQSQEQSEKHLSAWEKWILQKAMQQRDTAETKLRNQEEIEKEAELKRIEREKKKTETDAKFKAWIEQYDTRVKQKRCLQQKREKAEQQLKDEKKLEVINKAKDKFQEWLEKKNRQTKERCMKEKERKRQEKLEKELKQQKNEAAYQEWCEKAKNRPRTAPNSFGYSSGKLRAYYDTNAYPGPSFYNPIPWQSVEVPKEKRTAKKKASNICTNNERYF